MSTPRDIPKHLPADPPPWWTFMGEGILLACPFGHTALLEDHEVLDDGTVQPSAECPHEGCTFHETIRLMDWGPRP